MKTLFNRNALLLTLLLPITGCSFIETQFADSPYGIELQGMMDVCIEKQKNGLLSGIGAGQNESLEFRSDEIGFSSRNEISYPMQLNCVVVKQGQEHSFSFIKQSQSSKWKLSK